MAQEKLKKLCSYLRNIDSLIIAFSGGIDSTFLLYVAKECIREKLIAVTSISAIHKRKEIEDARAIAQSLGVEHVLVDTGELLIPEFTANDRHRCYYCKRNLFRKIKKIAEEKNIPFIAHGANSDDIKDYRPGQKAAEEYGIISPLIYADLGKEEIRTIAKDMGIRIWNKPSSSCLATRIPYGSRITAHKLEMVEKAENLLQKMGYKEIRVRHYEDMAKIEVPEFEIEKVIKMRKDIINEFKKIGFLYVSLDIEGFISGKLNRAIEGGNKNE